MIDKLYEVIFFIGTFLYLLFAFFLLTHKKGNRLSHKIFAGFCLSKAFLIISDICNIFRHSVYKTLPVYFNVILESTFFLIGPFLYFYTRSITAKKFVFKKIHLLHLIPFLLDFTFRNFRFFSLSNTAALMIERGFFISRWELISRYILMDIQVVTYVVAAIIVLFRYRSELEDIFSSIEKIKLSWLYLVLFGFLSVQLFSLSKHTLVLARVQGVFLDIFGVCMHFGSLLFAIIVVFKGLRQPEIFSGFGEKPTKQKYVKTALSQEKMEHYLEKLKHFMETEKPHLDPSLNINELADKLSIPSHYVSQILNLCLHQNFYRFVNTYRIEESKRIFAEKAYNKKTVLEVLYESGFNSKASFNSIFKQYTGITPTEFIASQKKD